MNQADKKYEDIFYRNHISHRLQFTQKSICL
jgi:hypothetical protein